MGKSSGSAPETPDPAKLIPLQSAADKAAFNYQTDANRYNTYGPDQSTTWDKQSVVDQAGYDKAMQGWSQANPRGNWVEGSWTSTPSAYGGTMDSGNMPTSVWTPGYWAGASQDGSQAPKIEDYTTYKYNQTTKLSDAAQRIHDQTQGAQTDLLGQVRNSYANPWDGGAGAPKLVGSIGIPEMRTDAGVKGYENRLANLNPSDFSTAASDAAYKQATRYLDPQVKQQQQQMEARLAEQGFVPGTPGYNQAMQTFQDTNNRQYAQARDSATTQGFNVGHTQFGDSMASVNAAIAAAMQGNNFYNQGLQSNFNNARDEGSFQNTARAQAIAESLQRRNQPMNEYNALMQGSQQNAASLLGGQGSGGGNASLGNTDVMGAYGKQYQGLMDKYNADVQSDNATTGALTGLASAALMFMSDEDLKDNINPIGETPEGHTVYEYDIDGRPSKGVLAQELIEEGNADAVSMHPSGYYQVDYSKVR